MPFESALLIAQIGAPKRPNLFEIFLHAGLMAWAVAGVLVLLSVASWAIAFGKWRQMRRADRASGSVSDHGESPQR